MSEVDYGWWTDRMGCRRYRVTWDADTKALYIFDSFNRRNELLDHINARERVDELLVGWGEVCSQPNSIAWIRGRFEKGGGR